MKLGLMSRVCQRSVHNISLMSQLDNSSPSQSLFFFQGFIVTLEPVLELVLIDQAGLELIEIHLPLPPGWH